MIAPRPAIPGARDWWLGQHLIGKFAAILLACALVFVPLVYTALDLLLDPAFNVIEEKAVADQAKRARHSMKLYQDNLVSSVSDYAVWDGSYDYMLKPDPAFIADTLSPVAYGSMGIDVAGYVTNDRTVRHSNSVDRKRQSVLADETHFFANYFAQTPFFDETRRKGSHTDFVRTSRGLFLVNAQNNVHSDTSGPSVGIVGMGILLDAAALSEALQVKARLVIDPDAQMRAALAAAPHNTLVVTGESERQVRLGLIDASGKVVAAIVFAEPRTVSATGRRTILLAAAGMTCVLLLLIGIVSLCIRRIAVNRLQQLATQVSHARDEDFVLPPHLVSGDDEIAQLARRFAALNQELDTAEEELRRSSYLQGKADSASGMLHNVRNALAPLRVVQQRWLSDEQQPYRINMERAAIEIDDPDCSPDRRKALAEFLVSAAREVAKSAPGRRAEMAEAKSTVDQIAEILGNFDFDTSGRRSGSQIDPLKVLRQEIKALETERFGHIAIELPDAMPSVLGNRVHLGQVFGNLLVNAAEAICAAAPDNPMISVIARSLGDGRIEICIRDNGDGIDTTDLAKVFERGFSTRDHKSGGIGMHWSANTVRSMGGELTIGSLGKGHGANAVLRLRAAEALSVREAA